MKYIIPFILYLYLIALHSELTDSLIMVYWAHLNLAALLVSLVALYKSEIRAMWFGFAVGLVLSAGEAQWMGWHALILSLTAFSICRIKFRLNLASIRARLLIVVGAVLVHEVLLAFRLGGDDFYWQFLTSSLPSTVYTGLWAWLFFKIKDGQITWTRIKELF